jgi:hypothetical protein
MFVSRPLSFWMAAFAILSIVFTPRRWQPAGCLAPKCQCQVSATVRDWAWLV